MENIKDIFKDFNSDFENSNIDDVEFYEYDFYPTEKEIYDNATVTPVQTR